MDLYMKIGFASCITFAFAIVFGWIAFPAIMKYGLHHEIKLTPETELRSMWAKIPFAITFKIYLFNVTNSKDVEQNGDAPMLDEIGPFVFDEWKSKENLIDNETDDTVSFNAKTRFYFNQELSGNLTGDEFVTIPHPVFMSILLSTYTMRPPVLPLAYKALNSLFENPTSMFLTTRVLDVLFDGIYINCNRTDFFSQAACAEMKLEKALKQVPGDGILFSLFGYKNESLDEQMKVKRGRNNPSDLNRVVEFKNRTVLKTWPSKECNQIKGTESSVYHTFLQEKEILYGFVPLLCRELPIIHVKSTIYNGMYTDMRTTTFGDMSKNENEKCYCPTKQYCLKKGAIDITKCSGAPIVVTFPHFYEADESYQKGVRGLRPDAARHKSEFYFEPNTGVVIAAKNRLQFNFQLFRMENVTIMQNVPESLVPFLWIEESISLNSTYLNNLDKQIFLPTRINNVVKWILISLSLGGVLLSIYLYMRQKRGFTLSTAFVSATANGDDIKDVKKSNIITTLSGMIDDKESKTN